ncbi:hypothetical protein BDV06DRAFT_225639 [Aspergillus oleicola]
MRLIPSFMCDLRGDPLLPDKESEQYLSSNYRREDLVILGHYGLRRLSAYEFIDKVWLDLRAESDANMRRPDTDYSWHSRMAKALLRISKEGGVVTAWLKEVFMIRNVVPFTQNGQLSAECLHVATVYPKRFMGFLLRFWKDEGGKITGSPDIRKALLELHVLCENQTVRPLGETYIHSSSLNYADQFLEEDEFFPWLQLDTTITDSPAFFKIATLTKELGFGYPKSKLEFYLAILRSVATANEDKEDTPRPSRIVDLYTRIGNRHNESITKAFSGELIRSAFRDHCLIYVPANGSDNAVWVYPYECLWDVPMNMQSSYPLKPLYERDFPNGKYTEDFFCNTLGIGNADIGDFLLDLEWTKEDYVDFNFSWIYQVYQELDKRKPQMNETTKGKISPRLRNGEKEFYEFLKKTECRETDGIASELHFKQDGRDIKVEVSQSELHFQELESRLVIYVPRDVQAQDLCFLDRIPRALMEWVVTESPTGICEPFSEKAVGIVSTVLQARTKYVDLTLDRAGIMSVETVNDLGDDDGLATSDSDEAAEESPTSRNEHLSLDNDKMIWDTMESTRVQQPATLEVGDYDTSSYSQPSTPSRTPKGVLFTPQSTPGRTGLLSPERRVPDQSLNGDYLALLRNVVNVARLYTFPDKGAFNTDSLALSLDGDRGVFQLRGLEKSHRDTLVGAAGELFVFETLSRLDPPLPNFSRDN